MLWHCGHSEESVDHHFSTCPFFATIWKASCAFPGVAHPQTPFDDLFLSWREKSFSKSARRIILLLLATIPWTCWGERNARVFLNKNLRTATTLKGLTLFKDWSSLCSEKLSSEHSKIWNKTTHFVVVATWSLNVPLLCQTFSSSWNNANWLFFMDAKIPSLGSGWEFWEEKKIKYWLRTLMTLRATCSLHLSYSC